MSRYGQDEDALIDELESENDRLRGDIARLRADVRVIAESRRPLPLRVELRDQIVEYVAHVDDEYVTYGVVADWIMRIPAIVNALRLVDALAVEREQVPLESDLKHRPDVWGFANGHNALLRRLRREE